VTPFRDDVQIATHFVTLGFFCLLLPLVIITPEVKTETERQYHVPWRHARPTHMLAWSGPSICWLLAGPSRLRCT
jgi:hypothetical protein